ncbi:MAG: cation:proton antiporter [Deltaproteobacteria bacterium]|nr:cation:proton antiporter [Deltaproteobacteria bacterium]
MNYMLLLALVLTFALVGGRIASFIKLPRVTGYLLTGLLLGPPITGFLTKQDVSHFHFISEIALGIIAFYIGTEFESTKFKKIKQTLPYFSASEIIFTATIVFVLLLIVLHGSVATVILLSVLSVATAPAATLLVIRELDSEGPLTSHIMAMVGINNLICIIAFVMSAALIGHVTQHGITIDSITEISHGLFIPVAIGGAIAIFLHYYLRRGLEENEILVLSLAGILLGVGLSYYFSVSVLLTNLVMGGLLVNICDRTKMIIKRLTEVDYPLYALFFTFAGASFHVEMIQQMGWAGLIYILARAGGKILGAMAGRIWAQVATPNGLYLGMGLMPQAGLAIGLSSWAAREMPEVGAPILSTILATTVVFEVAGPIMTMLSFPTLGQLKTDLFSLHHRIAQALGKKPMAASQQQQGPLLVKHLMRYHIDTIPQDAPLVVKIMQNSRHTVLPVIGEGNNYVGILSLSSIRDLHFDRSLKRLIIAKDIADYIEPLSPEEALDDAMKKLAESGLPYLPVVEKKAHKAFAGVIHRRDICLFELQEGEGRR